MNTGKHESDIYTSARSTLNALPHTFGQIVLFSEVLRYKIVAIRSS